MPVLVVHIRHMRVHMALRCVLVPVAVRAGGHLSVGVQVVAVVVGVGVFVVQGFVRVFMRVGFGQVQQHALGKPGDLQREGAQGGGGEGGKNGARRVP